ncbi:type II secretion system protein GspM [Thiohalorhabdus sp.]|uniref:type II secretion system protein GspM n=1 Tax=Thiohalorhabdus sp. TaxID=3094134 RepID=UPI002FC39CBE
MIRWLAGIRDWLDARQLRERLLLFAAVAAVLAVAGYEGLIRPALEREAELERQTRQVKQETAGYRSRLKELTGTDFQEERTRLRDRTEKLRERLAGRREALGEKVGRFIRPDRLMAFFEDLLLAREPSSISVRRVESLAREPVELAGGKEGGPEIGLNRKGVAVTYHGTFEETVGFLDRIEGLDWAIQVTKLDYTVLGYPRAKVALTAHTYVLESPEGGLD